MNRLILRYGYPLSIAILVLFAWVVYQRASRGWDQVAVLAIAAGAVYVVGVAAFVLLWPRITVSGYKRAILRRGLGDGPIAVNTIGAATGTPSSASASGSLLATGTDALVYLAGWLDLRGGPQVLHVPDMPDRYYSVQFTDPATSANFAYVGTRATGAAACDYLVTGPRWNGPVPSGAKRIEAPAHSVLVIGRVFVADDADLPAARDLAAQIRLSPLQ